MRAVKKPQDPMQKTIPRNPRYANIQATIDTGASISRYLKKIDEISENFKIKSGEIFRRMKMTTFVQLVIQVAGINSDHNDYQQADDKQLTEVIDSNNCASSQLSYNPPNIHSNLQSVINGIGEVQMSQKTFTNCQPIKATIQEVFHLPYLLLDVREREEFENCHIITALNYPSTMLSRCMNFETREMLALRNLPGHIIIMYDEDERIAPRVASTLTERGYENVFVLSGGLKVAWKVFPKGLILGDVPIGLRPRSNRRPQREKNILQLPSSASIASGDYASSIRSSVTSGSRSVRKFETYDTIGSRAIKNGVETFTMFDLAHLSLALDNLAGKSRCETGSNSVRTASICSSAFSKRSSSKHFK